MVEDLALERWRKLVWNIPFNGLTIAAGGIDVARLLADPGLNHLAEQLMREVIGIASMLGHEIPASFVDDLMAKTRNMGSYRPSSLVDFLEGREVEVEAIWGEPYRQGVTSGADSGRLETLYRLIHALASEGVD